MEFLSNLQRKDWMVLFKVIGNVLSSLDNGLDHSVCCFSECLQNGIKVFSIATKNPQNETWPA
jgi:SET domain-containing protein